MSRFVISFDGTLRMSAALVLLAAMSSCSSALTPLKDDEGEEETDTTGTAPGDALETPADDDDDDAVQDDESDAPSSDEEDGEDDEDVDEPDDADDTDEEETDEPTEEDETDAPDTDGECDSSGFEQVLHQAVQDSRNPEQPLFYYLSRNTDTAPFDELRIFSYQADPYDGPTSPGTYDLAGGNYADCSLCVMIIDECDDDYMCDKAYFASEGILEVIHMSMGGGPFIATLRDAVFEEVTIDADTYESTPVAGGESWCVDRFEMELPIQLAE